MHSVLDGAGVPPAGVDAVFLTGGSAQIPALRRMFADEFGEAKLKSKDYLTSVAVGLGLTAVGQARAR
jgi:molecular chaperone DnaK (HSP70)